MHSGTKNRLKIKNLHKLVYVRYNIGLRMRNVINRKLRDDDYYNPIDLNHIFEDCDALEPWTRELKGPLLDGQENDWFDEALAEEEDEQDIIVMRSRFRYYDDDDDDLYAETQVKFYTHDVYVGEDATRDDKPGVSGNTTVGRGMHGPGSGWARVSPGLGPEHFYKL